MLRRHADVHNPHHLTILHDLATKFVQKGYIRLKACVINGSVELHIEDSGPGIPAEKRDRLFAKFQESLDSLAQGTGIGLAVCRDLAELMGADIWLDNSFHSGVEDCPGTRFVLRLNKPAMDIEEQQQTNLGAQQWLDRAQGNLGA